MSLEGEGKVDSLAKQPACFVSDYVALLWRDEKGSPVVQSFLEGVRQMRECNDPTVDLDDLIFDEDDGYPSER
jgi:hypothetical protein